MALGRPDDALRLFERYKRLLDDELGVTPSAGLVRMQRAVLAGRREVTAPEPETAVTPPIVGPPVTTPRRVVVARETFLGRLAELRLLMDPEPPALVHVVGPIGAGKSAFLAELSRNAPGRVGIGHGPSSVGVLRLDWLRAALIDLEAPAEVLAVIDAVGSDRPLRRDELEVVATVFDRAEPQFLAVDEAGELDAASVAELAWLGRYCPSLRIVLTYSYPSQITGRPVASLGSAVVLRLGPLTADELKPLGDLAATTRTGGIPSLVAAAQRHEGIVLSVAMQVARLRTRWMPEPAWEVLRLCAVLGSLGAGDLAALTGRPKADVLACIDQLVHAHLLAEESDGSVGHRSTLVRDAVAEQVSSASSLYLREMHAAAS